MALIVRVLVLPLVFLSMSGLAEDVPAVDAPRTASLLLKVKNSTDSEVTIGFLVRGRVFASDVRIPAGETRVSPFVDIVPRGSQLAFISLEERYLPYVTEEFYRVEGFAEKKVKVKSGSKFQGGESYVVDVEVGAEREARPKVSFPVQGQGIPANNQIQLPPNNFPFYSREHGFGLESPTKKEYKSYRFLGVTRTFTVPDNPNPNYYGGHDANPARFKPSNVYKYSYNPNDSRWYSNDSKVWSETDAIPYSYDPGTGQWYRYGLGGWQKSDVPR